MAKISIYTERVVLNLDPKMKFWLENFSKLHHETVQNIIREAVTDFILEYDETYVMPNKSSND